MNVAGINEHSTLSVEILDREFQVISGYDHSASRGPDGTGFSQSMTWQNHALVENVNGQIRVRVNFGGLRPEDVRLYAVYIDQV